MKTILEIKNISYAYKRDLVLNKVSFCIKQGEFFVLLGLNAAGKSTLFSLITRLLSLQEGEIIINDYNLKNYKKALLSIGTVFQEASLDLDLSVRQNLYFYGCLKGLSFKETLVSIEEELDKLELREFLDVNVRTLNGGHRRRVEILRALINKPSFLLLDEATVGLDVKARFDILAYIRSLVKEKKISVLWITHLFDELEPNDALAIIHKGEIVENSSLKNIIKKYNKNTVHEVFEQLSKDTK